MKKKIIWILSLFMLWISILPVSALELDLHSKYALLINLDENKVLYEQEADKRISIASLTKIMTAIVTIENIDNLDEEVTLVSSDFKGLVEEGLSTAGFFIGEKVTYRDLLYGLLLPSGADAAQALTRLVANDREAFVAKMNEKAQELNMTNTHFVNETGLDADNHYSSLNDVAIMFRYALNNEELKTIFLSSSYTTSNQTKTFVSTTNRFIAKNHIQMDYLLGGKTGTTDAAGLCLASIAYENGTNYMLITANAPLSYQTPYHVLDAKTIYDYFIESYESKTIVSQEDVIAHIKTKFAIPDELTFKAEKDIMKYVSKDFQKEDITYEYEGIDEVSVNTEPNTHLGVVKIIYQDELIDQIDVTLKEPLQLDIKEIWDTYKVEIGITIFLIILLVLIVIIRRKKKRKRNQKK